MVSSLLSAQSASVCHRAEHITEALYKSVHVSLCLRHNDTLYIYCAREFLQRNLFNSLTCEWVQRSRGTEGLQQRPVQTLTTYMGTQIKKSSYLCCCFGANVSDPNKKGEETCGVWTVATLVVELKRYWLFSLLTHHFGPDWNISALNKAHWLRWTSGSISCTISK